MKSRLSPVGSAVAAVALAASSLLVTTGAAEAAGTGTVTVSVVDQFGRPADAAFIAFDQAGTLRFTTDPTAVTSTHTFSLPAGGYSLLSQGPWSGVDCYGISPCDLGPTGFPPGTVYGPAVTVTDGAVVSYTAHVTMPTTTGASAVGSTLAVQTSPGYQRMQSLAAAQTGLSGQQSQQWLRGSSDVAGATGSTYVTTIADASQQVAARLSPSPAVAAVFASNGYVVPPFTTGSVGVAKVATRTNALYLASGAIRIKVKATSGLVPDGKVALSLGKLKATRTLKNGKATIKVPARLEPGRYTLKVTYLGSTGFDPSKSKKRKVTVRQP